MKEKKVDMVMKCAGEFSNFHLHRALDHYRHAREKHPYFADKLVSAITKNCVGRKLAESREQLRHDAENMDFVIAEHVLHCEWLEFVDALVNEPHKCVAVSELYDAIAVLLRMVDVLEGRQKLGKPCPDAAVPSDAVSDESR